uniref:Uncharacterized protein n=1 Tax=Daphnia galeata TaxID=27404 RepID=A0A8J2RYH0_9CRUS|nr:unnamed protein product [Daphnia galeata]
MDKIQLRISGGSQPLQEMTWCISYGYRPTSGKLIAKPPNELCIVLSPKKKKVKVGEWKINHGNSYMPRLFTNPAILRAARNLSTNSIRRRNCTVISTYQRQLGSMYTLCMYTITILFTTTILKVPLVK